MGCTHTKDIKTQEIEVVKKKISVYELIGKSVYRISSGGGDGGWGTGFAVKAASNKTYILTNGHICHSLNRTDKLYSFDGEKYKVKVEAEDDYHDLCILQAPKNAKPLKVSEKDPKYRDKIYTAGFPAIPEMTTASGIVLTIDKDNAGMLDDTPIEKCVGPKYKVGTSSVMGMFGPLMIPECNMIAPRLQTSVKSNPGASGSPMINSRGEVIGVLMATIGKIQFAQMVPLDYVRSFLDKH